MVDTIQEIKNRIRHHRKKEEDFRLKKEEYRNKREELESLLKVLTSTLPKDLTPTALSSSLVSERPNISKEIAEAITIAMKDEAFWQLCKLQKHVESVLGRKIANSTIRSVLNKDTRFKKVSYGVYSLASCDTDSP